jgi:hypothetical protein
MKENPFTRWSYTLLRREEFENIIMFYKQHKNLNLYLEYYYEAEADEMLFMGNLKINIYFPYNIIGTVKTILYDDYSLIEDDSDTFNLTAEEIDELKEGSEKTIKLIEDILKLDERFKELVKPKEKLKRRNISEIYILDKFPGEDKEQPTCIEDCQEDTRVQYLTKLDLTALIEVLKHLTETLVKMYEQNTYGVDLSKSVCAVKQEQYKAISSNNRYKILRVITMYCSMIRGFVDNGI